MNSKPTRAHRQGSAQKKILANSLQETPTAIALVALLSAASAFANEAGRLAGKA